MEKAVQPKQSQALVGNAVKLVRAVFLDRDGTLIEDRGYLSTPEDVIFYPETVPALRRLQRTFLLIVVTNQSGVAKGAISRIDVNRVNTHMANRLARKGVHICAIYVCPHDRADGCVCIKPKPYFLHRASEEFSIDLSSSFVVGDHPHDVEFARSVGAQGIYVSTGHGLKHLSELPEEEVVVADIADAAEWILSKGVCARRRHSRLVKCSDPGSERFDLISDSPGLGRGSVEERDSQSEDGF
jgi:histidinol-phosphate phosphatase family protein